MLQKLAFPPTDMKQNISTNATAYVTPANSWASQHRCYHPFIVHTSPWKYIRGAILDWIRFLPNPEGPPCEGTVIHILAAGPPISARKKEHFATTWDHLVFGTRLAHLGDRRWKCINVIPHLAISVQEYHPSVTMFSYDMLHTTHRSPEENYI